MQIQLKHLRMAMTILMMLLTVPGLAAGQLPKSLVATANGDGTIKLGNEEFKIYAVTVKLFKDGKAEINLVTDITVFVNGTWSRGDDAENAIILKIKGNVMAGNMEGGGKLFLTANRKAIARLQLEVVNKTTAKVIKADFEAK